MGIAIEKKLTEAGYKMLGDDESIELLILNILKTDNIRYLKAIPFLIYKHKADINSIWKKIKSKGDEELFHAIYAITINLFNEFNYNNNITTNLNIKTNPDNLSNSSLETSLLFKGKNQYAGIYYNYIYKKKFFIESLIGYNTDYCDTNIKFIFENSLAASIILNTNAKINKNINIGCGIMYNYYNFIKYNYIFNIDYQYDNDNKLSILTNYNDFTIIPTIVHKLCDNCFLHFSLELNKKFDPKYGVGIYLNL